MTWIVSIIAFGLFVAEFTNEARSGAAPDFSVTITSSHRRPRGERTQVYGYEVVDLHAWEADEGETNAFAAPGRSGAMVIPQDVLALRAARVKTMRQKSARNK